MVSVYIEKIVDDVLKVEKWWSFVSGKVTGGFSETTATTMVDDFYEERDL